MAGAYSIVQGEQILQNDPPTQIEPDADGPSQRLLGLGLAGFKPGDYTLVLRVTDEVTGRPLLTA